MEGLGSYRRTSPFVLAQTLPAHWKSFAHSIARRGSDRRKSGLASEITINDQPSIARQTDLLRNAGRLVPFVAYFGSPAVDLISPLYDMYDRVQLAVGPFQHLLDGELDWLAPALARHYFRGNLHRAFSGTSGYRSCKEQC